MTRHDAADEQASGATRRQSLRLGLAALLTSAAGILLADRASAGRGGGYLATCTVSSTNVCSGTNSNACAVSNSCTGTNTNICLSPASNDCETTNTCKHKDSNACTDGASNVCEAMNSCVAGSSSNTCTGGQAINDCNSSNACGCVGAANNCDRPRKNDCGMGNVPVACGTDDVCEPS